MDSTRQNKFSRLIQKELSDLFQKEGADLFGREFITITQVKVSPDLGVAKVYLSIFRPKEKEKVLETIQAASWEIRKRLGRRIRHQARHIPELIFYIDDSLDYAEKIDRLLKGDDGPSKT